MISEGENYPVNGYEVDDIDDQIPDFYITDIVIEDPGSGYEQGDSFAGTDLRPVISEDDGSVIAVEIFKTNPIQSTSRTICSFKHWDLMLRLNKS